MSLQTFASESPAPGTPSAGGTGAGPDRSGRVFTIKVGGEWYGLAIERVRNVFRVETITPAPLTPPAVAGLINVRGEILAAIHTSLCLGFDQTMVQLPALVVSVEHLGEHFGLIVDAAGDVATLAYDRPVTLAANGPGPADRRAWPTYQVGDALYPVIDLAILFNALKAQTDHGANRSSGISLRTSLYGTGTKPARE